jgi:ferrous iron transport protein B
MGVSTMSCHAVAQPRDEALGSYRTIAVVGPPNSGKTTLFNRLTKLRQKVGNFPGVTVEHHTGYIRDANGEEVALIDLPGVYSLTPKSEDEKVAVDVLTGKMPGTAAPDAIILVLNSTNLHTHLVLAARVIALGLPTLVLLNMADELHDQHGHVDVLSLARELGTPVALVSATTGEGLIAVQNFLSSASPSPEPLELPVMGSARGYREWAVRVGQNAGYRRPATPVWTARLDALFLHRIWGPVVFGLVVIGVFQVIFALGQPLSNFLQKFLDTTGVQIGNHLPAGMFQSLIVNGIWKGTGSVLVFLPQILLLFLVIGILEDSGYLSRAAVIADHTMSRVGLNGKSFIPLLSAYACAVPAIMATRTIESKRDRMATILIAPFMTCSARLPVYLLLIAAFIPNLYFLHGVIGLRTLVMLGLYVAGFVAAFTTARLLKSSILKSSDTPFILELPQYRMPTLYSLGLRLMDRARIFLRTAGTIIVAVTLALWVLAHLPVIHTAGGAFTAPELANSLIGRLGHFLEPAIAPLGFNWKIGIGLVSSVLAREVMVSTMGTLYGADPSTQSLSLQTALHHDMTLGGALALMIFFAFAMQCTSTIAVVRRETNGWTWPAVQFFYMLALAYGAAFAVNHIVMAIFG